MYIRVIFRSLKSGTLIVVGDGKVVAWTIPTGDHVFGAQANINGSVWTTILDQSRSSGGLFSSASISPGRNRIKLELLESTGCSPGVFPRQSSCGHRVRGGLVLKSPLRSESYGCLVVGGRGSGAGNGVDGSLGCCAGNYQRLSVQY